MKLLFNPNDNIINEICEWLILDKSDFIYNVNSLSGNPEKFCVLIEKDSPIGFIIYTNYNDYCKIDVAVIKKSFQRKGVGKKFLKLFSEYLLTKKIIAIELECVPSTTKWIWQKLGFKECFEKEIIRKEDVKIGYPRTPSNPWLFKPLVSRKKLTKKPLNNFVQLWNCEPHIADRNEPKYQWNFEFIKGTNKFKIPIIHPVESDWNMRVVINGIENYNGKIKRFNRITYSGDLLIISELK